MEFQGEHLFWGLLGRASVIIAFLMAAGSVVAYSIFLLKKSAHVPLRRFARVLFTGHTIFLTLAALVLYIIIYSHYFEYNYVWKHSSLDTPLAYIISCFWAGQEGSFLIWLLLQGWLGILLMRRSGVYEPAAMAVVAAVQLLLLLNILGFLPFGIVSGSSPFALLRELSSDPVFNDPNYMRFITDGNGLNPLLKNPWMVSHPPLIFAGYALALMPFALAVSALVHGAVRGVLPYLRTWTLAALLLLGTGLIIGGAWAYEALTFGGFWAWDPVENASLVPWLILLAALHLQLVAWRKEILLMPAFIFTVLGYVFVIYATYLTRSGILAESSAHAFGSGGFNSAVLLLLAFVVLLPAVTILMRRNLLKRKDNSSMVSLPFVMYTGSIVLILSAFQIIFTTSLPVFNKMFGLHLAPPAQPELFYNNWQLPFAVAVGALITAAAYLSLKRKLLGALMPALLTLIFTVITVVLLKTFEIKYILLYLFSYFSIFISGDLLLCYWKMAPNKPAVLTHLGFGVFMLGVLMTFSNKSFLSDTRMSLFHNHEAGGDPQLVLQREKPLEAGPYYAVYRKRSQTTDEIVYNIQFYVKHNADSLRFAFELNPYIVLNASMGNVYEPDIKKSLLKDVFTYITYAPLGEPGQYTLAETRDVLMGSTFEAGGLQIEADSLWVVGDMATGAVEIHTRFIMPGNDTLQPVYAVTGDKVSRTDAFSNDSTLMLRFEEVTETENTIRLGLYTKEEDIVAIKAIIFPYINLMWLGALITGAGFLIALYVRKKKQKETP